MTRSRIGVIPWVGAAHLSGNSPNSDRGGQMCVDEFPSSVINFRGMTGAHRGYF